ncbi:hypothetical protein BJY01DRAFT_243792 [Aspergillus pseudoustus]|uniref:Uncharacterized protein n=1 Tax=Aspergillus pseudoustus TaxID=1810923 RepID=A0ABR4KR21_9EURO
MKDKRYPPTPRFEEELFYSPLTPLAETSRFPQSQTLPDGLPKKESVDEMLEDSPHRHIPLGQFQQVEFIHTQTPEQIDQQLQLELEQAQAYNLEEGEILDEDEAEDETLEEGEIMEDGAIPEQYQSQPQLQAQPQPYNTHQSILGQGDLSFHIDDFTHHLPTFSEFRNEMQQHIEEPPLPAPIPNLRRGNHHRRRHQPNHHRSHARRHRHRHRHRCTAQQPTSSDIQTTLLSNATQNSHDSNTIHPHPDFHPTLDRLARPLHPLISVTTGLAHPSFPKSILAYNMLTSCELNDLAIHFHQVYPPTRETFRYPLPVKPWVATNGFVRELGVDVEVKRRRFGRFIGLKGCESPVESIGILGQGEGERAGRAAVANGQAEIRAGVEREWERAREVARWEQEWSYLELEMGRERGRTREMRTDMDLEREIETRRPRGMYYL